jgi:hypothetical protein
MTTEIAQELDLTQISPSVLAEAEADKIKAVLPKLAGLKKIIAVVEARAKELLSADPDVFGGDWILKEGAMDRRIVDVEAFVERLLDVRNADGDIIIQPSDLLAIATFPVGKVEALYQSKAGVAKKMAGELLQSLLGDALAVGRKAPTLQEGK